MTTYNTFNTASFRTFATLEAAAEDAGFILDTTRTFVRVAVCAFTGAMYELGPVLGDDLGAFIFDADVALCMVSQKDYHTRATVYQLRDLRTQVNALVSDRPEHTPAPLAEDFVADAMAAGFGLHFGAGFALRAIAARRAPTTGLVYADTLVIHVALTDVGLPRALRGDLPATLAERPADVNPRLRVMSTTIRKDYNSRYHIPRPTEVADLINAANLA